MYTYVKNREHAFTTLYNLFLSLTDEPIYFFSSKTFCVSYILIGNRMRVKSSGMAPGVGKCPAPGQCKICKCPPPPGLTRWANALQ